MSKNKETFLFFKAKPYYSFCGISLFTIILIIAVVDLFSGLINLGRFASFTVCLYQGRRSILEVLNIISNFVSALSLIFAFNAIKSVLLLRHKFLKMYTNFKQIEFVVQAIISIAYEYSEYSLVGSLSYPSLVFIFITRIMLYIYAKVIWSAYILIKDGYTFHVLEGN